MAFSYLIIWFLSCCVQPLPCETQNVFFGFKDRSGADQALHLRETNVTITCNVSCVENAMIQITGEGVEGITNNHVGNSLDYTIDNVTSRDFTLNCIVSYNASNPDGVNELENVKVDFSLPVFEDTNKTCRRNGTVFSTTYHTRDILSLQCFCYLPAPGSCQWYIYQDSAFKEITFTQSNSRDGKVLLLEATVVNVNASSVFVCGKMNHGEYCLIYQSSNKVFPSKVLSNECDRDHTTTTDHTSFDKVNNTTHTDEAVTIKTTVTKKTSPFENFFEELKNVSSEVLVLGVIGIVILVITICIIIVTGCLIRSAKVKIKEHDEEKKVPEESMYADIPEKMPESALGTDVDRLYDAPPFMTKGVVPNYYIKQQ